MARTSLGVVAAGTLLSLAVEEEGDSRDQQRGSPLGVDPYLAVPNIVLLYNEHRLKNARLREAALSANQRGPIRQRVAIGDTEDGLSEMAGTLAQHLPNVFHYPSERQLRKQGRESRGLDDLETYIRLRIDDLSSVLESRVRRRDRWTAVVGIAVGVVTAFLVQQAIEGKPTWLISPALSRSSSSSCGYATSCSSVVRGQRVPEAVGEPAGTGSPH